MKRGKESKSTDLGSYARDIFPLLIALVVPLALFLGSVLLDIPHLWGLNYWKYYSTETNSVLLLLTLVATVAVWSLTRHLLMGKEIHVPKWTFAIVLLVAGLAFVLLHARTHFLGDGYALLSVLPAEGSTLKLRNFGGMLIPYALMHVISHPSEAGALLSYQIVSIVSGCLFMLIALLLSRDLVRNSLSQLILWLGLCTGGYALLFFGYVENYALFVVAVLIFCLCGVRIEQGKLSRWWILPALAASFFFHIFGLVLFPAALYVLLKAFPIDSLFHRKPVRAIIWAAFGLLAVSAFIYLNATSLFFRFSFVPLFQNRITVDGYTTFSLNHLLDILNLLLVLVPGILVFLAATGFGVVKMIHQDLTGLRFLVLAGAGLLVLAFAINPMLGMPRDWDLFAAAGVPMAIIIFYCLLAMDDRRKRVAASMAVFASLIMLSSRVATLTLAEVGSSSAQDYIVLDPFKNRTLGHTYAKYVYEKYGTDSVMAAQRSLAGLWPDDNLVDTGTVLMQSGEFARAVEYFAEATEVNPLNYGAWANLGRCLVQQELLDSAVATLRIASGLNPYNSVIATMRGYAEYYAGNHGIAEAQWRLSRKLDTSNTTALLGLFELYRSRSDEKLFNVYLDSVVRQSDAPPEYLLMRAVQLAESGNFADAGKLLKRASAKGLDSAQVNSVLSRYPAILNVL